MKKLKEFFKRFNKHQGDFILLSKTEVQSIIIDIAVAQKKACCNEIYPYNAPLVSDKLLKE